MVQRTTPQEKYIAFPIQCGSLILSRLAGLMTITPKYRSVLLTRPRVSTFPLETVGGKKQGVMGGPMSSIVAEYWRFQIELPSVEPDSETGKY